MNEKIEILKSLTCDILSQINGDFASTITINAVLYSLFVDNIKVCPDVPKFVNRDRVIMAIENGEVPLLAMLHLAGYPISVGELEKYKYLTSSFAFKDFLDYCNFDLSQAFQVSVGMALSQKHLSKKYSYNTTLIDYNTYLICDDKLLGDGGAFECIKIAYDYNLDKLKLIYIDYNSNSQYVENLFKKEGWHTIKSSKNGGISNISYAINEAKNINRPTIVIVPVEDKELALKSNLWQKKVSPDFAINYRTEAGLYDRLFMFNVDDYKPFNIIKSRGNVALNNFEAELKTLKRVNKNLYKDFIYSFDYNLKFKFSLTSNEMFTGIELGYMAFSNLCKNSSNIISFSNEDMVENKSYILNGGDFTPTNIVGRNFSFNAFEKSMSGICLGFALSGGMLPFVFSSLEFASKIKYQIKNSAIHQAKIVYVFSYDSAEEMLSKGNFKKYDEVDMLREINSVQVFRPATALEVELAFKSAYDYNGVTCILLSKQNLLVEKSKEKNILNGLYLVKKGKRAIGNIICTGSELELALKSREILQNQNYDVDIYSLFEKNKFLNLPQKIKNRIINLNADSTFIIEGSGAYTLDVFKSQKGLSINLRDENIKKNQEIFNPHSIAKMIIYIAKKNGDIVDSLFE